MPSINEIVESELSGAQASEWLAALARAAREALGRHACGLLDVDAAAVLDDWQRLDNPQYRSQAIKWDPQLFPRCVELLEGALDPIRTAVRAVGYGKQSVASMRPRLLAVLPALMNRPASVAQLLASPFADNWSFVGDALARCLHAIFGPKLTDAPQEQWRLMNHLILAEYFRQCTLPEARLVAQELREAGRGILSIRGALVCTANRITAAGAADDPLRISAFSGGVSLHHAPLSDLLDSVSRESQAIAAGQGVMQRLVSHHHHALTEVQGGHGVSPTLLQQARGRSYPRYEHSISAYMAVAAIEQMLRSCAQQQGVNHLRAGALPAAIGNWVGNLSCDPGIVARVREFFDSDGANVRNRLMHSGFLLTESTHLLDNLALADPGRYGAAAARPRPHTPENVDHLALELLRGLDPDVRQRQPLVAQDLSWAQRWCLTPADLRFSREVYCDMIPRPGGPTVAQAIEWQRHLSRYFSAVMPGLGQFFRLAYVGFMQRFSDNSFPLLHALGMVFEAIYRLTAHLIGLPVLASSRSGDTWYFQYLMIDESGLHGSVYVERLVQYLEPHERGLAKEVLRLAVQARNALAHGAVVRYDEPTHRGMGHLLLKATQLLVGAGEHHMTREAAWYRWRALHPDQDGYAEEDWFAAEPRVLQAIATLGDPRRAQGTPAAG